MRKPPLRTLRCCAVVASIAPLLAPAAVAGRSGGLRQGAGERWAIVVAERAPLRRSPSAAVPVVDQVAAGEQLRIVGDTADGAWSRIVVAGEGGIEERLWIRRSELFDCTDSEAEVEVDVSLLEVPEGHLENRVAADDFTWGRACCPTSSISAR